MKTDDDLINEYMGEEWPETIPYIKSWDALMLVVEKIIRTKYEDGDTAYLRTFGMQKEDGQYMVRFNCNPVFWAPTLIEATYLAVLDFIKTCSNTNRV